MSSKKKMTDESIWENVLPQLRQIGGKHYKDYKIQPYEFISKNNLSFYQGVVIKYVVRYLEKGGIEDLEKIIHYTQLEIHKLQDDEVKAKYKKK
tara:strand:+ start:241 stop:522 length:282 start_codon:yes stop_codon:yes gene_type:complete